MVQAAYYDPTLNGGAGGYWTDATMGNGALGNVIGNQPHQANFYNGTYSTGGVNGYLTDVGAFTMSLSAYGLYDASGDVYQRNDAVVSSNSRRLRGGAWDSTCVLFPPPSSSANRSYSNPNFASSDLGFRLAMVPEPSPLVALVGGAALLFAGRRRRALRVVIGRSRQPRHADHPTAKERSSLSMQGLTGSTRRVPVSASARRIAHSRSTYSTPNVTAISRSTEKVGFINAARIRTSSPACC